MLQIHKIVAWRKKLSYFVFWAGKLDYRIL